MADLTIGAVAKLTGLSAKTLWGYRHRGTGPPSFLVDGQVRYAEDAVRDWLAARQEEAERKRLRDDDELARRTPLEVRVVQIRQRLARLHERIAEECPGGSSHAYVDHGDDLPPWCDRCGFTDTGLHLSECGSGEGMPQRRVLKQLQATLRARCPGEHRYVQHGDGKPPWCDACGLTIIGLHFSVYEVEDHESSHMCR